MKASIEVIASRFGIDVTQRAGRIVAGILADLLDRRGWGRVWDGLDEETKREIVAFWEDVVDDELDRRKFAPVDASQYAWSAPGNGWRTALDSLRQTCLFVHASGLWVEASCEAWAFLEPGSPVAAAVSGAFEDGIRAGLVGRHTIEVTHLYFEEPGETGALHPGGSWAARLVRVEP